MSAAAVKWAIAQNLPQTEKAVLLSLARAHSPRWGRSDISQQKIADEVGVTRETVNRRIVSLASKGLISVVTEPRKKGQWDRRLYILAPLEGGIKAPQKSRNRVTQDHTAPCDSHQTRHRVTQDHTSRADKRSRARGLTFSDLKLVSGGAS
ncbi:helix-turn-helix domain-containing protein [Oceaniglobus trochenteri]|uniref:helix-turn-helix domain-containing protein n=1 Tax=Oceaniglobus trochenteri TaxID=2763260 RepID=UPI001D0005E0|nr:helix-turn-helix domain-containing protein [Oceaniglobus trochenteri]